MSMGKKPIKKRDTKEINDIVNAVPENVVDKSTNQQIDLSTNRQIDKSTNKLTVKMTFYVSKEVSKKIRMISVEKEKSLSSIAEEIFENYFSKN